jgi:hypothetical protein
MRFVWRTSRPFENWMHRGSSWGLTRVAHLKSCAVALMKTGNGAADANTRAVDSEAANVGQGAEERPKIDKSVLTS